MLGARPLDYGIATHQKIYHAKWTGKYKKLDPYAELFV